MYQGSLQPLFASTAGQVETAEPCLIALELTKRWLAEQLMAGPVLTSPTTVREYLRVHYARREYQSFSVLFLDAQHRLIRAEVLFRGTLTQTSVYTREVVKVALQHNAAAVLLAHKYPSGVAESSRADEALTQALKQALALVDIRVLDHFVTAGSAVISFAEQGLL